MRRRVSAGIALLALALAALGSAGAQRVDLADQVVSSRAGLRIVRTVPAKVKAHAAAPSRVLSVAMVSRTQGYALAQSPTIGASGSWLLATEDGGVRWNVRAALPGSAAGIQFVDGRDGFAWTPTSLLTSVDGGRRWRAVYHHSIAHAAFVSAQDGIATSQSGALMLTQDGGRTWRYALANTGLYFSSVSALPGPRYYAIGFVQNGKSGSGTSLYVSTDGGATWTALFSGIASRGLHPAYLAYIRHVMQGYQPSYPSFGQGGTVTFTTPSDGWMTLFDGGFLSTLVARTTDGGRTWTYAWGNGGCAMGCNAMGGGLYPAAYLGAQDVWRFDFQSIDRSTDGGVTFQKGGAVPLGLPASNAVRALQFVTPQTGIAGTTDGILRTTNGGRAWTRVWPQGPGPLSRISMTASGYGLAVASGQPDLLWRTQDGGRSWQLLRGFSYKSTASPPQYFPPAQISGFWAFSGGQALVYAGGSLYGSRDEGKSWRKLPLRLPPVPTYGSETLLFSSPQVGWDQVFGMNAAYLYRTSDGGRSWTLSTRSLQAGPTQCAPVGAAEGWCLNGRKSPKLLPSEWKVTLLYTADGGKRFTPAGSLPMRESVLSISFSSPSTGVLAGSRDLLLTQDYGRTFTDVHFSLGQYGFLNQVEETAPGRLYVLTDGGRLFYSSDGGGRWRQLR